MAGEMSQSEVTRENFPGLFQLQDELAAQGIESEPRAFDQYQGPYLYVEGVGKCWYDSGDEEGKSFLIERRHLEFETEDADIYQPETPTTAECGSYLLDSAVSRIAEIVKASR